jgi:lysophospholipase L1-like esterase
MPILRNVALLALAALSIGVSGYAWHESTVTHGSAESTSVTAPAALTPTQAAFIGDSYTQGKGATSAGTRWVSIVAKHEGWEALNFGRGGTGYVTTADVSGCGLQYCPSYPEMIPTVQQYRPSVIVVAGGQNDFSAWSTDPNATAAAINDFYVKLRQVFPKATIIAVGPSTPQPTVTQPVVDFSNTVQAAAQRVNAEFVSLISPDVIQQSDLLPDHQHVDDHGHAAIAAQIEHAIDR